MSDEAVFWLMEAQKYASVGCCKHCDHEPDYQHVWPCLACPLEGEE